LARWRQAQRQALGIERHEELPDLPHDAIQDIKHKHKSSGKMEN
jgi:hypothetical protein